MREKYASEARQERIEKMLAYQSEALWCLVTRANPDNPFPRLSEVMSGTKAKRAKPKRDDRSGKEVLEDLKGTFRARLARRKR